MRAGALHFRRRMERAGLCYSTRTESRIDQRALIERAAARASKAGASVPVETDRQPLKESGEKISNVGPHVSPAEGEFFAHVGEVVARGKQSVPVLNAVGDAAEDQADSAADGLRAADGFAAGHGELPPFESAAASVGAP